VVNARQRRPARSHIERVEHALFQPLDARPLGRLRILLGLILTASSVRALWLGWIHAHYIDTSFRFSYHGLSWLEPLPGQGPLYLAYTLAALGLLLALGIWPRVAAGLLLVGVAYELLIDKALYLNHMYLVCLLLLLMTCVPSDRAFTVQRWRNKTPPGLVPAWSIWILQGQLLLVYFFAGVWKLQADWLQLMPIRMTLELHTGLPIIGPLLAQPWVHALAAYGIIIIEIGAPLLLLNTRTRVPTMIALAAFHLGTAYFYNIGIFPWLCLALLTLFLPPRQREAELPAESHTGRVPRRVVTIALSIYATIQVFVPLHPLLYPGDASWTREGHCFSWRLLLSHKSGWARFVVFDPLSKQRDIITPFALLTPWQAGRMAQDPDMMLQVAQHLADEQRNNGFTAIQVRVESGVSLNGRPVQALVDPRVDLGNAERTIGHAEWILPLQTPLPDEPTPFPPGYFDANTWGLPALARMARRQHESGELDKAARTYKHALLVAPKHISTRLNLALALRGLNRHGEAQRVLEALLEDAPERVAVWRDLTLVLLQQGQHEHARRVLQRARIAHPTDEQLTTLAARLK